MRIKRQTSKSGSYGCPPGKLTYPPPSATWWTPDTSLLSFERGMWGIRIQPDWLSTILSRLWFLQAESHTRTAVKKDRGVRQYAKHDVQSADKCFHLDTIHCLCRNTESRFQVRWHFRQTTHHICSTLPSSIASTRPARESRIHLEGAPTQSMLQVEAKISGEDGLGKRKLNVGAVFDNRKIACTVTKACVAKVTTMFDAG